MDAWGLSEENQHGIEESESKCLNHFRSKCMSSGRCQQALREPSNMRVCIVISRLSNMYFAIEYFLNLKVST
jgi:hypothetical protein